MLPKNLAGAIKLFLFAPLVGGPRVKRANRDERQQESRRVRPGIVVGLIEIVKLARDIEIGIDRQLELRISN